MNHSELKRLIREIAGNTPNLPITAEVTAIEGQTCRVKIAGMELSGVRLKAAVTDQTDFLLITPKIGSVVICLSRSGDLSDLTVIQTDQVQKIEYTQNGLSVIIDSTDARVSIRNDAVSLIDLFSDLTSLLKQLQLSTPAGISGTPLPPTIAALNALETKYKQLLK